MGPYPLKERQFLLHSAMCRKTLGVTYVALAGLNPTKTCLPVPPGCQDQGVRHRAQHVKGEKNQILMCYP